MSQALDTFVKALQEEAEAKAKASITAEKIQIDQERQEFQRKLNAMEEAKFRADGRVEKMEVVLLEVVEELEDLAAKLRLVHFT